MVVAHLSLDPAVRELVRSASVAAFNFVDLTSSEQFLFKP